MITLREFSAAMQELLNVPLARLNTQLDPFLVGLTRRTPVHRLSARVFPVPAPRHFLTLRQRRLQRSLLRELRSKCRVRR